MASPASKRNNKLGGFIKFLMQGFAVVRELGEVVGSRFAFELSETRAPEPDIAVEIVARESRTRDYVEKKNLYESAGVLEYWIIDPLQRRAEFYRLIDGQYNLVPLEQNRIFRSESLAGFWLDVEWLFAEKLPNEFHKLQEILIREDLPSSAA